MTETLLMEHQEAEGHWGPTVEGSCRRSFVRKCEVEQVLAARSAASTTGVPPLSQAPAAASGGMQEAHKLDSGNGCQRFALGSPRASEDSGGEAECIGD